MTLLQSADDEGEWLLHENGKIVWIKPARDSLVNEVGSSRNGKQGEVVS